MMTKVKGMELSNNNDTTASSEEINSKQAAKKEKVERRRSIEDYVARKRWKEENEDLVDLYDAECY